jgi:hypothetical protein
MWEWETKLDKLNKVVFSCNVCMWDIVKISFNGCVCSNILELY